MKYVFIINPASGKTDYNKIKENEVFIYGEKI